MLNKRGGHLPDEDYEILPHEEIEHLRKEVEKLKASPFVHGEHGENLLRAITELNENISSLVKLFKEADEKMAQYYQQTNPAQAMLDIKQQNETLAKGMLALADLMRKQTEQRTPVPEPRPAPVQASPMPPDPMMPRETWNFEQIARQRQQTQTTPPQLPPPSSIMAPGAQPLPSTPTFRMDKLDDFPTPPLPPPRKGFFGRK
jgi:hypothetical protein